MAETEDRAALLAEAYKRGILPADVKSAYEEAMSRGLLSGGAQPAAQSTPAAPQQPGGFRQRAGEFLSGANDVILGGVDALTSAMTTGQKAVAQGLRAVLPESAVKPQAEFDAGVATPAARTRSLLPTNTPTDTTGRLLNAAGAAVPATLAGAAVMPAALTAIAPGAGPAAGPIIQGTADALRISSAPNLVRTGIAAAGGGAGGQAGEEVAPGNPLARFLGSILGNVGAGAATSVLEGAGRRFVSPVQTRLNSAEQRLADVAKSEGIGLTAAQETGSRPLATMESVFKSLPLTAGPQKEIADTQVRQFNKAVLARAGINADRVTPEAMRTNSTRLSNEFERISAATVVNIDDKALDRLQEITTRYATKLPSQQREIVENYVNDVLSHGNAMPGQVYQTARSDLTRQFRPMINSPSGDSYLGQALKGIRDTLDDAMDRSVPTPLRDAWDAARSQWAAKSTIERAMASGAGTEAASGNIPTGALKTAVASGNRGAFAQGRGDLTDLARIGEKFIRDPVQNSGTQERTMMANLLTGAGAGSGIMSGDPVTAVGTAALAIGGPRAAQMVYNTSPVQRYLRNGAAIPATPPDDWTQRLARQLASPRLQ